MRGKERGMKKKFSEKADGERREGEKLERRVS